MVDAEGMDSDQQCCEHNYICHFEFSLETCLTCEIEKKYDSKYSNSIAEISE